LTYAQAADAFNLSTKAVSKAKDDESESKDFSLLSLPKIQRDRMHLQRPLLTEFFKSIEPVSGLLTFIIRYFLITRPHQSHFSWHAARFLSSLLDILPKKESAAR
jgi:hypothetical protein